MPITHPAPHAIETDAPLSGSPRWGKALPKAEQSTRTIAHQMAEEIGAAIVHGELQDGARILEEELAQHYRVSRSPVREAIDLLERRGLVRTEPRRGTYVVGFTPALITDLFNVRGVLVGLAARYVAQRRDPQALADLQAISQALTHAAQQPDTPPHHFAKIASGLGHCLLQHCQSDVLRRMVSDHGHLNSWGMIWRERPVDFLTQTRRQQMATDYARLCELMRVWDADGCETCLRTMLHENRDHVLAELSKWHTSCKPRAATPADATLPNDASSRPNTDSPSQPPSPPPSPASG